jgi:hypothetical protein
MITKDYSQFEKLIENEGKQIHVEFVSNGKIHFKSGVLKDLERFWKMDVDQAITRPYNSIYFLMQDQAIITVLDDNGSLIYHNQHISRDYNRPSDDTFLWTRYFSGFDDNFPEGESLDEYASRVRESQEIKELRKNLLIEGGRVVKNESRPYWNNICDHLTPYGKWIAIPALEVMKELAKGYHPELDKISSKYGLSGYQYFRMEHIIHRCALNPHPVIEHELSGERLPEKLKRPKN